MKRAAWIVMLASGVALADAPKKPAGAAAPASKPSADDPWEGRTDLFVAPITHQPTKVDLGDVERFTLPNGLRVIAVARHSAPVIDVTVALRIEDDAEPADKTGLTSFVTTMLHKGTQKRTADQLADRVEGEGAELDASSSDSGAYVSCRGRARDLTLCLDVVSDSLLHPTFPASEMDEVRSQLIASVEQAQDTPSTLAQEHAANLYYGDDDPRGRPLSKRSIAAIDRDSIVAFYKTWFHPEQALIAVSGDFDPKTLRGALVKWFGAWKRGAAPRSVALALPPAGPMKIRIVDKPDATQSQIVILGPGIRHADPDLCAVRLMNYSLGEGAFSSRLMKIVRSQNAKTYDASTHFQTDRDPGPFEATTFTREAETAATMKLVLGEIDKMKRGGPTDAELASAKANLIGGYGLHFETASDVARQLIVVAEDELPVDFPITYPGCLDQVTLAQAAQAARDHLSPQALVVVGNAAVIGPQLAAAKLAATEVVGYTDPISAKERAMARAAVTKPPNATPTETEEGKKILKLALAAKGADSVARVTALHVVGAGTMTLQGQHIDVRFEGWYVPGTGQQREDVTIHGQTTTQVLSGGKAFTRTPAGVSDLPKDAIVALQRDLWRNANLIVLNAASPGVQVRALPPVSDGKKKVDVLNVVAPTSESVELELDQKTHQLEKAAWIDDDQKQTLVLTDYRPEAGLAMAHHLVQLIGDQRIELQLTQIDVNKPAPKDAFAR